MTYKTTIKESLKVHSSAEDYLRYRYGAYRGHFAWRELEEAYSQGRYDEEMLQGPYPYPGDEPTKPDCRTCRWLPECEYGLQVGCTNGDQYQAAPAVVLWRTE